MSFILDALKKAESERHRQAGPALMAVRVAVPQRRLPTWAWVLGCVLLTNLLALAWLLLRSPPSTAPEITAAIAAGPSPTPPSVTNSTAPPTLVPAVPAATPLAPPPAPPLANTVADPVNVDTLPSMQDLLASGVTLPTLLLNLHVYDEAPANRYILLNSKRMREGDELPDGIKLERITPQGVILNARGRRFVLVAGG